MKTRLLLLCCFFSIMLSAQSDLDKVVKGGELLLNGLTILKGSSSQSKSESKPTAECCVKNKLAQKITFRIAGKDKEGNDIKKELVIQKDGRECILELPKGIYQYEILLASNEIYKKGDYRFEEEATIIIKE